MRRRGKKSFLSKERVWLTPLIDCVSQLLIFYMVTTVFIQARGVDVDPPIPSPARDEQQRTDISIVLEPGGHLEVSGDELSWEQLEEQTARAMEENNSDKVMILADPEVIRQLVVDAVDAAKAAGPKGSPSARRKGGNSAWHRAELPGGAGAAEARS